MPTGQHPLRAYIINISCFMIKGVSPLLPAVDDLYQWRCDIGDGGQGSVCLADSRGDRRPVAVKRVRIRSRDAKTRGRLQELSRREATLMQALHDTSHHRLFAKFIDFHEGPEECSKNHLFRLWFIRTF
jgi:serine/threonine protein kinase